MANKSVGTSFVRKDGVEKVTGRAVYGADLDFPDQLYAAIARSPYAHAKILSVDTSEAEKIPGVEIVLTGKNTHMLYGQFISDQPVIAYEKVRYEGEPVAAIAADDPLTARKAADLVKVEYEELPVVNTIEESLKGDILVHENWDDYEILGACHPQKGTNIGDVFTLRHGDVEKGFAEADVIAESDFYCSMLQHATIETHVAIARFDDISRELHLWAPVQSPFSLRGHLAKVFGLDMQDVRITCTHIGGAFGAKYEPKCTPLVVALAMKAHNRPVKLVFDRHEEFKCSICRSPVKFHIKTGAKKDGTLVAQSVTVYWDAGAYVTTTPRVNYNAGFAANGPYKLPNARVDGFAVMTNRTLGTAYRGFGVTEVATAHEHNMDKLAVMLDMDPLELRLKNILCEGDETISGQHINTIAVKECLEAAADNIGWKDLPLRWEKDGKLYGKGIACFNKLTGTPSTTSVLLRLNENGSLTILSASREMGQGVTTVLPQIASQALALDWEKIDVSPVDTQFTPYDKTTTSSRSTFHGGNAVLDAAEKLKKQLITLASIYFDLPESDIIYDDDGNIRSLSHPDKCVNINEIGKTSMMKEQPPVVATGTYGTSDIFDAPDEPTRQSTRPTVMWMHGAQAAIVEIDKGTGRSTLVKMGAGHDVGKAVNPLGCMQQIEGSIIMGWGHTVMEEMIYENGILKNGNMVDYKVPTFMDDTVEMNISLIEHAHPEGPYGVKGIGEPGLAPTAAAIANAICNACGREFTSIPIKPEQILLGEE